jgi:fluoride exporter
VGPAPRNPGLPVAFAGVNRIVAIALGGVIGSLGRFAVAHLFDDWSPATLPWATLTVNVLGCLLIGAVAASASIAAGPDWLRPFVITGVLGGFTTFSALALETGLMLDAGRVLPAAGYVVVTMVAGLLAVRLGQVAVEARR